jgi:hypothetical protein
MGATQLFFRAFFAGHRAARIGVVRKKKRAEANTSGSQFASNSET